MAFIPMMHQSSAPTQTRHSRELSKRMEQVIRDYRRENPDLTADEIRAALSEHGDVAAGVTSDLKRRRAIALSVAAALGAAGALAGIFAERPESDGGAGGQMLWPVLTAVIVAALAAVAVSLRSNR